MARPIANIADPDGITSETTSELSLGLHRIASGVPSGKESIGKGRADEGGELSAEDAGRASGTGRVGAIGGSSTGNAGLALGGGIDLARRDAGGFSE